MPSPSQDDTRHIVEALSAVTRQLARASGGPDDGPPMTATQRLALIEAVNEGPLRLSELAARLGITAPTASRAVDGLVDLGLLERLPDPDDRRAVRIDVTRTGRKHVEERKARVVAALEPAVAALPVQDRARLAALLEWLADALS
jgi:DNA-binding MarR family transcriptional regulator